MKKYPLPELVQKWAREEVTVEQAIGQILLWIMALAERVTKLEANRSKPHSQSTVKN